MRYALPAPLDEGVVGAACPPKLRLPAPADGVPMARPASRGEVALGGPRLRGVDVAISLLRGCEEAPRPEADAGMAATRVRRDSASRFQTGTHAGTASVVGVHECECARLMYGCICVGTEVP